MLFTTFEDLVTFIEGAVTRFLGPFFVGGVITLVSMFISFTCAADIPFLWNSGRHFDAVFVTFLVIFFGYSVLYFYFMAVIVDPGKAPTVPEYEALAARRARKNSGKDGESRRSSGDENEEEEECAGSDRHEGEQKKEKEEGQEEDEEDETFYTVDESVLDPSRPPKLVECIVCNKCECPSISSSFLRCLFHVICVCFSGGAIKVPRSHHCKACGCCTLKMDHHCGLFLSCVCLLGFNSCSFYVVRGCNSLDA